MDFRTTIHIADNMGIMHHSDRFMMLGSCFSDNIGGKLHQAMIDVNVNPFGTLYNPMSIASSVNRIIDVVPERGIDLFQGSGVWNSYNFHSRYSLADKEATLTLMNEQIAKAHEHLKSCHTLVVTLGTAVVYRLKETNLVVANCHKVPQHNFTRRMASVDEITEVLSAMVERLHEFHKFLWGKISSANDENTKKSVNCLLQALFFETLSIYGNHRNVAEGKRTRNEQIFFDFFTLVERNFKVNRSIAYYAKLLCISPKHLSATIKIMSGQTASEWIDNYVIIAAKAMLRSSSKTIQQISNDLNFSNQSFFGKFFKKYVGVSPTEYRTLRAK